MFKDCYHDVILCLRCIQLHLQTSLMTSFPRKICVVCYIIRRHSVIFNPLPGEFLLQRLFGYCSPKKVLEISSTLVYNLLRKVIGSNFRFALSKITYFEIAFTLGGGMLFLFVNMIVYVRQSRKHY